MNSKQNRNYAKLETMPRLCNQITLCADNTIKTKTKTSI